MNTKRTFTLLLALVMMLSVLTVCVPAAHAAVKEVYGNVKLSSFSENDVLKLTGSTTLTIDVDRTLKGIRGDKFNLTIQGDGTHKLTVNDDTGAGIEGHMLMIKQNALVDVSGWVDGLRSDYLIEITTGARVNTEGRTGSGIYSKNAINCTGCSLTATGATHGIESDSSVVLINVILRAVGNGSEGCGIVADSCQFSAANETNPYSVYAKGTAYGVKATNTIHVFKGMLTAEGGTAAVRNMHNAITMHDDMGVILPRNGKVYSILPGGKVGTVYDADGNVALHARLGVLQELTGTVGCVKTKYTYGEMIYPKYTGLADSIPDEDRIITWQRSANGSSGWVDLPNEDFALHAHPCRADDVLKYIRPKMEAIGYTGTLYGAPVYVDKSFWGGAVGAPDLSFDGTSIIVNNAVPEYEYRVVTRQPTASELASPSFWSGAKQATEDTLALDCSYGRVNYVYCRYAEDDCHHASSGYNYASVSCDRAFDLWIGGTKVKDSNCSDPLGNSAFAYDPETNTLTIKSSYTCSENVVENKLSGTLKVQVIGENVKLSSSSSNVFLTYGSLSLRGLKKLTMESPKSCPIYARNNAVVNIANMELEAINCDWGISGTISTAEGKQKLVIENATLRVSAANSALCDFQNGIHLNGSYIKFPQHTAFQNGDSVVKLENGSNAGYVEIRPQPFSDIKTSEYWFYPIMWAYEHDPQITTGTDSTHFSPKNPCTRSEVVTFLWRTMGSPEPSSSSNPFTDVKTGAYYYKAVLWAVENGITNGASATLFNPKGVCTREQVVTFLYRAVGEPTPGATACPFVDVSSSSYAYNAILWAISQTPPITTGTNATHFSPKNSCTRGQVVTFLYRAFGPKG